MLTFDHCYTKDVGHRFLARMGRAGFTLDPNPVEHPGRHVCRFIPFSRPGSLEKQYLEFISLPRGKVLRPGLSFSSDGPLSRHFARIRRNRLRPTWTHRNYDWKANGPTPRRLGWNFVNFRVRSTAVKIWLTEYERPDGKPPRWKVPPRHANGALGVVGLVFEANAAGRRYFSGVLGRGVDGTLRLPCGTLLELIPARKTRFAGVVVKCRDLSRFIRRAKPDAVFLRDGKRTAVFKNPTGAWDVFVV